MKKMDAQKVEDALLDVSKEFEVCLDNDENVPIAGTKADDDVCDSSLLSLFSMLMFLRNPKYDVTALSGLNSIIFYNISYFLMHFYAKVWKFIFRRFSCLKKRMK